MRILNQASIALTAVDATDGHMLHATALCTRAVAPPIRNASGHLVYLNLQPDEYEFTVQCQGYTAYTLQAQVQADRCNMCLIPMMPVAGSPQLVRRAHLLWQVTQDDVAAADIDFSVTVTTMLPTLRLMEAAAKGAQALQLASTFSSQLLLQRFICGNQVIMLEKYLEDTRQYVLTQPLAKALKRGDYLQPYWLLHTNRFGVAALPVQRRFLPDQPLEFMLQSGKQKITVTAQPQDICGQMIPAVFAAATTKAKGD